MSQVLFSKPAKHIAIIRLSAIGDVTHMMPIIATLQKEWPDTKITWIIGAIEYSLVKQLNGIQFIIFNKRNGFKEYFALKKKLKNQHFDALLMMQTSLRASLISLCIKAPIKLGFDTLRAHDSQSFFSNQHIDGAQRIHVLDTFFLFLEKLGIQNKHFDWLLKTTEDEQKFARKVTNKQPYVVINPSSSIRKNNYRNWSNEHYAQLIDQLIIKKKRAVILTGGPSSEEIQLGKDIEQLCQQQPINLIGQTSLMQLLALLEGSQCVVAPDTGPAHMATIVDTPVIGLFASSNPLRTGPYKSQAHLVNKYPDALQHYSAKTIDQAKWGERVRHPNVMSLITVDHIMQKINALC